MTDSPEQWFHRRATHYVEAQVLFHLSQAGVFHLLDAEGPCTVTVLAERLGLVPEVLATALEYVWGVDQILERDPSGLYGLTGFGRVVLERYSRDDGDRKHFNFFDVRVGAYGPIWSGLGQLLTGESRYGEDVQRLGEVAASAVYTVSARMIDAVHQRLQVLGARTVLEVGVATGLLSLLRRRDSGLELLGLDRSAEALDAAQKRAGELGAEDIAWQQADFFAPQEWAGNGLSWADPVVLLSVHFHELLAAGTETMITTLRELGTRLPGLRLLVLEQPRLPDVARDRVGEVEWLYSQSNVLIHHLIGNGRILSQEGWISLFEDAGGVVESCDPLGFLGYNMVVVRLEGGPRP